MTTTPTKTEIGTDALIRLTLRRTKLRMWVASLTLHHPEFGQLDDLRLVAAATDPAGALIAVVFAALNDRKMDPTMYDSFLEALDAVSWSILGDSEESPEGLFLAKQAEA